jgi:pantothenate synthetase
LIIYNLTKLYQDILQNNVSYHCIFGTYGEGLSFSSANSILRELQNKEIVSLNDWIELITDRLEYSEEKSSLEKILINRINSDKEKTVSPIYLSLQL